MLVVSVNQDPGIAPGRQKGAAVHLEAMRNAFRALGCSVMAIDEPDASAVSERLAAAAAQRIDLMYERYALGKSAAARFARERNIPFVVEVNSPLAEEQVRYRNGRNRRRDRDEDGIIFAAADRVIAVSGDVAAYARERGAREGRITVCPNGVDESVFNLQADGSDVRRKHVPDGAFVLGFHGRVRPWHGFGHLVALVRRLRERGAAVHLLVAGAGEYAELNALPEAAYTRLGWLPYQAVAGVVAAFDAMPLTYSADVPCYFSPLKLREAMACGVVPIVPDLGDLPKIVRHRHDGLVYPAGDFRALEAQVETLMRSASWRRSLGQAAAATAARHSWKAIAKSIVDSVGLPLPRTPAGARNHA